MTPSSQLIEPIQDHRLQFRPWRELALIMIVLMEISWVTPWFRSLTPATYAVSPLQGVFVLLGIVLVGLWTVRLMDFIRLNTILRQTVTIGLLGLCVIVGLKTLLYLDQRIAVGEMFTRPLRSLMDWQTVIPDEFIIVVTVLISWWRGISLAQERIGPTVVRDHFSVGIVMFFLFGFINTMITGETPGIFIFIFLLCGLIGMSAARISVLGFLRGGSLSAFDRRWFGGVILASLVTVGLAILFGDIFSKYMQWIAILFLGLFGLLALLFWVVLTPILALLIRMMNSRPGASPILQQMSDQIEHFQEMMGEFAQRMTELVGASRIIDTVTRWMPGIKIFLLVSILLLIIAGILTWLIMQLWKERRRRRVNDDQQDLIRWNDIWNLFQAMIREQWKSLVNSLATTTDLKRQARLRVAARVRQVYADLLELCEELGRSRLDSQTPLEYFPVLVELFPEHAEQVILITQGYLKVRYGELPETSQELTSVEEAWRLVQKVGKGNLEVKRKRKTKPGLPNNNIRKPRIYP
jgi:hypothetical protein